MDRAPSGAISGWEIAGERAAMAADCEGAERRARLPSRRSAVIAIAIAGSGCSSLLRGDQRLLASGLEVRFAARTRPGKGTWNGEGVEGEP